MVEEKMFMVDSICFITKFFTHKRNKFTCPKDFNIAVVFVRLEQSRLSIVLKSSSELKQSKVKI